MEIAALVILGILGFFALLLIILRANNQID